MVVRNRRAVVLWVFVVICTLLGGAGRGVYAFTLYEDFSESRINPDRWIPTTIGGSLYDIYRGPWEGALDEWLRVYGGKTSDTGVLLGRNELKFTKGSFIAVKFDMAVWYYALQGCSTPGSSPSRFLTGFNATVFNNGSSSSSSNKTGDVGVGVLIVRGSDSTLPSSTLGVEGTVFLCTDSACNTIQDLGTKSLGEVAKNQFNTFTWDWDVSNSVFHFQKNSDPVVSISHAPHVSVSKRTFRNLQARGDAANCTAPPTPFAEVEVTFDNVYTRNP